MYIKQNKNELHEISKSRDIIGSTTQVAQVKIFLYYVLLFNDDTHIINSTTNRLIR